MPKHACRLPCQHIRRHWGRELPLPHQLPLVSAMLINASCPSHPHMRLEQLRITDRGLARGPRTHHFHSLSHNRGILSHHRYLPTLFRLSVTQEALVRYPLPRNPKPSNSNMLCCSLAPHDPNFHTMIKACLSKSTVPQLRTRAYQPIIHGHIQERGV